MKTSIKHAFFKRDLSKKSENTKNRVFKGATFEKITKKRSETIIQFGTKRKCQINEMHVFGHCLCYTEHGDIKLNHGAEETSKTVLKKGVWQVCVGGGDPELTSARCAIRGYEGVSDPCLRRGRLRREWAPIRSFWGVISAVQRGDRGRFRGRVR